MKKLVLSLVPFLVAGVAVAGPAKAKASAKAATKTHAVAAEVVSADTTGKQITFKTDDGQEKTVAVEGKAATSLTAVKPGEKVKLTFRDNAAGDHEAVTAIVPSGYHKSTSTKPAKAKTSSSAATSH
jgi:hypothetical protein